MIDYTKDILTNEQLVEVAKVITDRLNRERTGHRSYSMMFKTVLKSIKAQQKKLKKLGYRPCTKTMLTVFR